MSKWKENWQPLATKQLPCDLKKKNKIKQETYSTVAICFKPNMRHYITHMSRLLDAYDDV